MILNVSKRCAGIKIRQGHTLRPRQGQRSLGSVHGRLA
jgi:hypothetical protein